ncbi:YsnF/AvaK domain-containing protein [Microvirga sp. CF3016]|uniref:YsnF/AvaK domain-containing protein n=1 Tax=Microvirga sp. CF3016 TaxID=3110181 RepID=UPI002E768AD6|nr:YsnF/AvaK domain-containing protein [Microvirga sp. CF3016]MEE1610429.1 YsnF/AvaK domain-containing protein [Microvirga sp. CF3016]
MTNLKADPLDVRDVSSETEVIPLVEEEVRLDKRTVTTGRVRVRTTTEVETELAKATLDGETVEVTRVPIDRMVDRAPDIRTEGDVTIIPVLEEVLVVEKRLVLKEELHVRKRTTTEAVEVPVELRKQRAIVEHIPVDDDETNNGT